MTEEVSCSDFDEYFLEGGNNLETTLTFARRCDVCEPRGLRREIVMNI
jgi:hypothetical protein